MAYSFLRRKVDRVELTIRMYTERLHVSILIELRGVTARVARVVEGAVVEPQIRQFAG